MKAGCPRMLYLACFVTVFLLSGPTVFGCLGKTPGEIRSLNGQLLTKPITPPPLRTALSCTKGLTLTLTTPPPLPPFVQPQAGWRRGGLLNLHRLIINPARFLFIYWHSLRLCAAGGNC